MRISLLHNADAGTALSAGHLRQVFERAGHELVHVLEERAEIGYAFRDGTDLVVAAGGDGTVWRAASALIGREIPLAILPHGTANNIARSLGIVSSTEETVASWRRATRQPLDLGVVRGAWGESWFIEGVGSGLVPAGIRAMECDPGAPPEEDSDSKLTRAVRKYRDVLSRLGARDWALTVDGVRERDKFLLVEVLNIGAVGPNLALARDADPFDGSFELVVAGEEDRAELDAYLADRVHGKGSRLALPTRRVRRVEVAGWEELHVDDQVVAGSTIGDVTIAVEPAALQVLR